MPRSRFIIFSGWGLISIFVGVCWWLFNTMQIPASIVDLVSIHGLLFALGLVGLLLDAILYAIAILALEWAENAFDLRKTGYATFVLGNSVTAALLVADRFVWSLFYFRRISRRIVDLLGLLSSYLCPPGILLMEIDPMAHLNPARASACVTVIFLNGALYSVVWLTLVNVSRYLKRLSVKH